MNETRRRKSSSLPPIQPVVHSSCITGRMITDPAPLPARKRPPKYLRTYNPRKDYQEKDTSVVSVIQIGDTSLHGFTRHNVPVPQLPSRTRSQMATRQGSRVFKRGNYYVSSLDDNPDVVHVTTKYFGALSDGKIECISDSIDLKMPNDYRNTKSMLKKRATHLIGKYISDQSSFIHEQKAHLYNSPRQNY